VQIINAPPALLAMSDTASADRWVRKSMSTTAGFEAAAVLSGAGDHVTLDLWTANPTDSRLQETIHDDLHDAMRRQRLTQAGVAAAVIDAADQTQPSVNLYSPRAAEDGRVSLRDQLPTVVGFAAGLLLWTVVLTGAGILLNSVIEEKGSRILEILLTSASVPEVMGGKILGVAGVSSTVLVLWASIGVTALATMAPALGGVLIQVLFGHGLALYFGIYFILGYLMYASIFAAVGAFCETSRDAQTLLGPVMLLLTIPVVFMGQSIRHPDAPILQTLSWIPLFTPFLMVARAASNPPLWQVLGTLAVMIATTVAVVWLSGRAFRAGALSFGKFDPKAVLASLFRPAA
jgi:ABC-2 type transport system permease protein